VIATKQSENTVFLDWRLLLLRPEGIFMIFDSPWTDRPVVGLTVNLEPISSEACGNVEAAFLPATYLTAVVAAGALPVLLPPQVVVESAADQLLRNLDGLIVIGGPDIDPARYGQPRHPKTDVPQPARDDWEDALIRAAVRMDLPLLCICRGQQMLNVALGGTLHQHLPDIVGSGEYQLPGYGFNRIPVDIRPGSLLSELLGSATHQEVPVSHHQAVDVLAPGLVASSWSRDQVVEAIEYPDNSFCLGVQWHPEELPEEKAILAGFVACAAGRRQAGVLTAAG
jgi:putative glutamine amidotransferase